MRKFLTLALITSSIALTACNTVRGVGADVKSAGETVEEAAKDVQ